MSTQVLYLTRAEVETLKKWLKTATSMTNDTIQDYEDIKGHYLEVVEMKQQLIHIKSIKDQLK